MDYINRLKTENADLKAQMFAAVAELEAFRAFLSSAKFVGVESDGGRKDWIATGDVNARLMELRSMLEAN